ncbi:MAG: phosphoribosylaminoimidazolesuccinocarboxamide synthase [Bryobacteraceae bacterium]
MGRCENEVILETDLSPLPLHMRGKVRDVYDLGDCFLFIATDRISAFDCVLASGIPCKGRVLTQMSLFWFNFLKDLIPSHVLESNVAAFPRVLQESEGLLEGRSMLVSKAKMIPVECVARGYLAGSGTKEYRAVSSVCGIPLPAGLQEGDRLPEPIFTPASKSSSGHDENVSFQHVEQQIGPALAARVRDLTLEIYQRAATYAAKRGILLADTKLEFGFVGEQLVLADEVLTPDSSRYWPADSYRPGGPQISFDKQYVRDFLETLAWDKRPPAPALPDEVVKKTTGKYLDAYARLTGQSL